MDILIPHLDILPRSQLELWPSLVEVPDHFTLYGGTALALRIGHRISVDFDFFSNKPFDPDLLAQDIGFLNGAERVQVAPNTLTCRINRNGPVLVSFFGNLHLGQASHPDFLVDISLRVASLLDIAATKLAVVQKRAEAKDYIDIDALIGTGISLTSGLKAAQIVFGETFNPIISLKALCYFADVPEVPLSIQNRLRDAVKEVSL